MVFSALMSDWLIGWSIDWLPDSVPSHSSLPYFPISFFFLRNFWAKPRISRSVSFKKETITMLKKKKNEAEKNGFFSGALMIDWLIDWFAFIVDGCQFHRSLYNFPLQSRFTLDRHWQFNWSSMAKSKQEGFFEERRARPKMTHKHSKPV